MVNFDVPAGEVYKGASGVARDSVWLTSEDLPHDRDVVVTVEKVTLRRNLTMQGGRPKAVMLSLKFVGKDRELGLNATNRKAVVAMYGSLCAEWFGKRVTLFVEQDVRRPDGTRGPAVRIRPEVPAAPTREAGAEGSSWATSSRAPAASSRAATCWRSRASSRG